jgi:hypothetical protein
MKLILMLTPPPPLTSEMTAVPMLCPFASLSLTVTGLEAANAETANRAAEQRVRSVKVDRGIVYMKKETGVRSQESESEFRGAILTPDF